MGEIAESMINGDFDFFTGEYMGRGHGTPRTKNKSLEWERGNNKINATDYTSSKEAAFNGVKGYIAMRWSGRKDIPSVRNIVGEYTMDACFDLKKKCLEIQKDFGSFVKFINKKLKTQ
jgi:hypothetical protein